MTDEDWHKAMLSKLDEWLHWKGDKSKRPSLFSHMYMSPENFIRWRETGFIAKETRICWVVFDDEICRQAWGQTSV